MYSRKNSVIINDEKHEKINQELFSKFTEFISDKKSSKYLRKSVSTSLEVNKLKLRKCCATLLNEEDLPENEIENLIDYVKLFYNIG